MNIGSTVAIYIARRQCKYIYLIYLMVGLTIIRYVTLGGLNNEGLLLTPKHT